jgi:uncharacterized OB-fold protein
VAPPGYSGPVPYGIGIVELDGTPRLRIVARLSGPGVGPGVPVSLTGEELPGPDGEPALTWAFHT